MLVIIATVRTPKHNQGKLKKIRKNLKRLFKPLNIGWHGDSKKVLYFSIINAKIRKTT